MLTKRLMFMILSTVTVTISSFYAVMNVLGFDVEAEVSTAKGRVDAVLMLCDKIYVIEFKYIDCEPNITNGVKKELFAKALQEGLRQIEERGSR
ncbi:MAG: PD-(D/E)XK nuclease domain-containing protein [Clostridiales bacterium]|nr:PD-(D/E)XK nuclease domain-containing protein [Clostridiales bacterium]